LKSFINFSLLHVSAVNYWPSSGNLYTRFTYSAILSLPFGQYIHLGEGIYFYEDDGNSAEGHAQEELKNPANFKLGGVDGLKSRILCLITSSVAQTV
jgi:hypothetical protein